MKISPVLVVLAGAASMIAAGPLPALAKSPAMTACSQQWDDMKKANKVPAGEKWTDFWSQCSKDYAAKNGADTAAGDSSAPAKAAKPKKVAAVSEDEGSTSAQQKKDCDAKWTSNKAKTGAHGWHAYFQFMAGCM